MPNPCIIVTRHSLGRTLPACVLALAFVSCQQAPSQTAPTKARPAMSATVPAGEYQREELHDTRVGPDEQLVNVNLVNNRWPDCYSNATAIADIFRIEGVADKSDQDKALALWKWFRILTSATGGGYCYERDVQGDEHIVMDPHKILTVYGHHMCDGLSWAMVPLWRAAGYVAFDECHIGHTIASLRYKDADGQVRFHDLDPQGRIYYWDDGNQRVGTWTIPLLRGKVHRHLLAPQEVHTLRTSLTTGEQIWRGWDGHGCVMPTGKLAKPIAYDKYYAYAAGKKDGVFAVAGEEVQTLKAELTPEGLARQLYSGGEGLTFTKVQQATRMHPAAAGKTATAVYRLNSPYVAIDAKLFALLVIGQAGDTARLSLSTNGGQTWQKLADLADAGRQEIAIDLGREARAADKPNVFGQYEILIKVELAAAKEPTGVGLEQLELTVHRELNKRTLPNLLPGRNVFRVSADKLAAGRVLELEMAWRVNGQPATQTRNIAAFPFYFEIDTGDVPDPPLRNYDQKFNVGPVQMDHVSLRLVPAGAAAASESLPAEKAAMAFKQSCPHPADLREPKSIKTPETDIAQTSGFFPQGKQVLHDPDAMAKLIATLRTGGEIEKWMAAEDLGAYPEALDVLLAELPKANIDLTLFICKALAQIGDKKAIPALLDKWIQAPQGAPGTRYIPDALAAIGDPSVVPALVAPLKRVRFDYRLHIAYALGKLGGPLAIDALADMAANDPFPAVKQFAAEQLAKLRAGKKGQ